MLGTNPGAWGCGCGCGGRVWGGLEGRYAQQGPCSPLRYLIVRAQHTCAAAISGHTRRHCPAPGTHLVVDVELVHMAAVQHQAHIGRLDADMHTLQLPRLVLGVLIAVKGQVAQLLGGSSGGLRHGGTGGAYIHIDLAGDLDRRQAAGVGLG